MELASETEVRATDIATIMNELKILTEQAAPVSFAPTFNRRESPMITYPHMVRKGDILQDVDGLAVTVLTVQFQEAWYTEVDKSPSAYFFNVKYHDDNTEVEWCALPGNIMLILNVF
jgi:hypothetical protein